jgi:hypothetical protein
MAVVAKTLAGLAGAHPTILDPSESSLVEGDRSASLVTPTDYMLVLSYEDDERGDRQQDQPNAQDLLPGQHEPEDAQCKDPQPRVAELAIDMGQPIVSKTPLSQSSTIDVARVAVHL